MVLSPITNEDGTNDIVHFCGYEKMPTEHDIQGLKEELAVDEEFGLVELMKSDPPLIFVIAPDDIVKLYRNEIVGPLD